MSTYLKNMVGYKNNQLKNKRFDDIQKLFDKAMKRVNTFIDMETKLVEGSEVRAEAEIAQVSSSKRADNELEQESIKKQKVGEDKEIIKLQRLTKVVPDKEEVEIDVIPLATKPLSIVDYKIHKEGKKTYYQIIRADGSSKMYLVFSHMLKSFGREDLETLWKLIHSSGINNGKGGAIVYTRWIEKMESVQDMSGCRDNQKVKYTAGSFVGRNFIQSMRWHKTRTEFLDIRTIVRASHVAYIDRFHELARSLKKNPEKRGNSEESSRDRNARDENKRTRTRNAFCLQPLTQVASRMVNSVNARNPTTAPGACYECGGTNHFKATCPRLNQAYMPGGNRLNKVVANNGGQSRGNNGNQARGRSFMLGAKEARQDQYLVDGYRLPLK
ncbi:reverse transcriptase domain-containing protein [Tanacetum coccineum]